MFRWCDTNTISIIITVKVKSNEMKTRIMLWQDNHHALYRTFKTLYWPQLHVPTKKNCYQGNSLGANRTSRSGALKLCQASINHTVPWTVE